MQHMARGGYRIHQQWGLMAPASPPVGEQPVPTELGHARRTAPHGQATGFNHLCDKDKTNPLPLGGKDVAATNWVDGLTFRQLCSAANRYNVPHDEGDWFDDEFPDKEDELRVAVADAMGKVGK